MTGTDCLSQKQTKCDRKSPCASCVTLNVACRNTGRAGEKRQRVLLSSKYEDAVQDVSRQLADVREMLQNLMSSKDAVPSASSSRTVTAELDAAAAAYTPQSMIDEQVPVLDSVQEGYNGDTSFTFLSHQIKTTLEATLPPSELGFSSLQSNKIQGDDQDEGAVAAVLNTSQSNDIGLGNRPLPPSELVLKLLRLAKTEDQRFFVDLPLFDEDEFIAMCRDIYFATEPVSLWSWICVNGGLYILFLGISEAKCGLLGTSMDALREHGKVLQSNAEAALKSLRLCSEPSTESCRALAILVSTEWKRSTHYHQR
jgi:hypothetical protein